MGAMHTPGPWTVKVQDAILPDYAIVDSDSKIIAETFSVAGDGDAGRRPAVANARLIAAAPDMLNVLRVARDCILIDRTNVADCHMQPDNTVDEDGQAALDEYDAVLFAIEAAIAKATGEA